MAKETAPAAPKAPTANAPKPEAPKPEAPAAEKPVKREKKPVQPTVYPTADEAKAEAAKRTYGPRKAYTVSVAGKTVHCVAYNDQYAAYEAFIAAGGTIEELGGTSRGKKPPSAASVAADMKALPPEQLAELKKQLAAL